MTEYRVVIAPMGCAVVMTDDEGNQTTVEYGIKSYASAVKKAERWTKREASARAKAEREAK